VSLILDVLCAIFKIATFLVATLLSRRYMRADVLGLVDQTSLITPHFYSIEVSISSQESEWSCIYVRGVDMYILMQIQVNKMKNKIYHIVRTGLMNL